MSILVRSLSYIHTSGDFLFRQISLSVPKGGKASLTGYNGTGKSTLLKLLAGIIHPAEGDIVLPGKMCYIPQHSGQYDHLSIAEALKVEHKLSALQAILQGSVEESYFAELENDWDIEERIRSALGFWGLGHLDSHEKMAMLSGGEKTRVFLAGILIHDPEIILLDEPSNHMDRDGRALLYELIKKSKATILTVSHDRELLNLSDLTFELTRNGVEQFGGNYDFYVGQKEIMQSALQSQLDEQQKSLRQAREKARDMAEKQRKREAKGKADARTNSMPRIIAGGLKSKAQQSTARMNDVHQEKVQSIAENIQHIQSDFLQYQVLKIDLGYSGLHTGKNLIEAQDINFSYGEKDLWHLPLTARIRSGDRIRIEGNNGAGKSTLLKIIMGKLLPASGELLMAPFRYLYLDQDYTIIDPKLTVYQQVEKHNDRKLAEHELKSMLHYFQFPASQWDHPCGTLSGGEKMKLAFCCSVAENNTPDILILDEPANNLDMQSLRVLSQTVKNYRGTVLVVSHDRFFTEELDVDKSLLLSPGL
ncbi:ABC-F family ATP-binding cassette domain-containing protein [Pararcticibacter amylolyticus]|uniref:ABC transporter ATP-binding protein n=1 Tax=Pararcticibacter amylolyticus TaxID=2173175 RepID=A0A2U2PKP7_9SPHI|nr:ABC-F family ATP-binding cassette domain-containing protein [Pararcticibacter amylolyticus]PWG81985.1 ABC transporter ATP-binding protein [Pararcticibacter amylolyticus]